MRLAQLIAKLQALQTIELPATNAAPSDPVVIRIDLGPDQDFHITGAYVDDPADYEQRDPFVVIEGGPLILAGNDIDTDAGEYNPDDDPCPHTYANIIAVLGPPGPAHANPAEQTWWPTDNDHYRSVAPLGVVTTLTAATYLGLCALCSAPVVRVQSWPADRTTPEDVTRLGAGWSTPWIALQDADTPPNTERAQTKGRD